MAAIAVSPFQVMEHTIAFFCRVQGKKSEERSPQFSQRRPYKGGKILRTAAGDQVAVLYDLLVDKLGPRVFDVLYDRFPPRYPPTSQDLCGNQQLRGVADGKDRLGASDEPPAQPHR